MARRDQHGRRDFEVVSQFDGELTFEESVSLDLQKYVNPAS